MIQQAWPVAASHAAQKLALRLWPGSDLGDCLFHSLGYADQHDGVALRIEVAAFLRDQAAHQEGFEDAWRREAAALRRSCWAGHTAIAAYSLLKQRRVLVHMRGAELEAGCVF